MPGQSQTSLLSWNSFKTNMKKPQTDGAFLLIKKRKIILHNYYYLSKKNI